MVDVLDLKYLSSLYTIWVQGLEGLLPEGLCRVVNEFLRFQQASEGFLSGFHDGPKCCCRRSLRRVSLVVEERSEDHSLGSEVQWLGLSG